MFTLFRRIRQKLIDSGSVPKYLLYAVGEILLVMIGKPCPVRDEIWVETNGSPNPDRAVRYGIYQTPDVATNHIAYQPMGGHGLRHAALCLYSIFYRYAVPTGQSSSAKFQNPFNPCSYA